MAEWLSGGPEEVHTHIDEMARELRELLGEMYATGTDKVFDSQRCTDAVEQLTRVGHNWVDSWALAARNEAYWRERTERAEEKKRLQYAIKRQSSNTP